MKFWSPYIHTFKFAFDPDFLFMDDNAAAHETHPANEFQEDCQVSRINPKYRLDLLFQRSKLHGDAQAPKGTDEKIPRYQLCNGVFCQDGRCVPDMWMCGDRRTNENLSNYKTFLSEFETENSVQEREAKSNREVKYTAPQKVRKRPASTSNSRMVPNFNSDNQSLNSLASDKKSQPEIQYFWGDQQEARTTESCTDDKLIKV
ncbi:hypothetical protein TNCV_5043921 [Trichonephila clavipes]|uniref:Uncharacterized protein n=1 Tax=Trichonephila clavipes TaxID=2585209 RepID=A0A8X6WJ12_TRICX|nr:hypothetical protein TNCV_5043921 [Trichonephila clavipes]